MRTLDFIGSIHEKKWKCKPCVRTLSFIGSVHEKKWKVQAVCQRTWFKRKPCVRALSFIKKYWKVLVK